MKGKSIKANGFGDEMGMLGWLLIQSLPKLKSP